MTDEARNYSLRVFAADGGRPGKTLREHRGLTFTEARARMSDYSAGVLDDDGRHHARVGVLLVRRRQSECLTA